MTLDNNFQQQIYYPCIMIQSTYNMITAAYTRVRIICDTRMVDGGAVRRYLTDIKGKLDERVENVNQRINELLLSLCI